MRSLRFVPWSVAAMLSVLVFTGAVCEVSYCSDDCDPCVSQCKCHHTCSHSLTVDFVGAHALRQFVLTEKVDRDGRTMRTFGAINGLSVDRALGPRSPDDGDDGGAGGHAGADFELFARNVIAVNERWFGRDSVWQRIAMERANGQFLVTFERTDTRGAPDSTESKRASDVASVELLVFLFDRAGNLLEIAQQQPFQG